MSSVVGGSAGASSIVGAGTSSIVVAGESSVVGIDGKLSEVEKLSTGISSILMSCCFEDPRVSERKSWLLKVIAGPSSVVVGSDVSSVVMAVASSECCAFLYNEHLCVVSVASEKIQMYMRMRLKIK